ncbi:MAG: hypothetical protein U0324_21140 [Polyangiales bacterium]
MTPRLPLLTLLVGVVLGALGASMVVAWRRSLAPSRTYCSRCAMRREPMPWREELRPGPLHALLAARVGAHEHRWALGGNERDPDLRALRAEAVRDERDDLDAIERDPRLLGVLAEATRDDPARAARLLGVVIDPDAHVDRAALRLVDRPGLSWRDRWRLVDGFFAHYRCERERAAVTCTLPVGAITAVAWHRVPHSLLRGEIPWDTWTPPGFVAEAPTPALPTPTSAPTGPSVLTPIPPPPSTGPTAPPTTDPTPDPAPPAPSPMPAAGDGAAVDRGIALARAGRVNEALALYASLSRRSSPPAGLGRLAAALRTAVPSQVDTLILEGRCASAQALHRQARGVGITYDARDHFGSACPQP